MNNFPPMGRGLSHQVFGRGRGRIGNFQQQYQNSQGPPVLRGAPFPGMAGRGRMNSGYHSFNNGRGAGRGRNNIPGRNTFGARGGQHLRPPPPPPPGRGIGQGIGFPPPPPPPPQPNVPFPQPGAQLGPSFQNGMKTSSSSYGMTPGPTIGNQAQQPQNGYHHQQQQHQQQYKVQPQLPVVPAASSQQQQTRATNNISYGNYQQGTNPTHKPYNQAQFPMGTQQQPASAIMQHNNSTSVVMSSPSAQQIKDAWKEYTAPSGVKYYHNELLKESTYQKPDALKDNSSANSSSSIAASTATSSSQKRTWQEHIDTNTGRKYYSDGAQTTWEKPADFVSPETIVANTSLPSKREEKNVSGKPFKKKKTDSSTDEGGSNGDTFANKKEATTAFKGFLLAKGISPTMKWNEVLKVCESNSRWDSFKETLSMGERRQALAEYQTKRSNEIRNEQRQERVRAKEAYVQMLANVLPSIPGFSARTSRFLDIRDTLAKDDKFFAVEDESTRESLFLDFCDDFKKREERTKRNKKREAQESFVSFLGEREEGGSLSYASTWESFLLSLSAEDKADARFQTSNLLNDSDRQLYFADYVLTLQKAEDDKRRRIQDARRRAEKAQRDQYRDLLSQMAANGKIFPYSHWRDIKDSLIEENFLKLVECQDRNAPRDIFELFIDEWDEVYRRERNFLSRLLHPPDRPDIVISAGTTFESFKETVIKEAEYSPEIQNETLRIFNKEDPISSARLLFDELSAQNGSRKRPGGSRRGSTNDDSSEDEGEIIEDGEVIDSDSNNIESK